MKKDKSKNFSRKEIILNLVGKDLENFDDPFIRSRIYKKDFNFFVRKNPDRRKLYIDLYHLKKQGLVEIKKENGKSFIYLTRKGVDKILDYQIKDMEIKTRKAWDKKWRMVTFDIPETKRFARDTLRAKLKDWGFLQIQKSIFVFPYECHWEIESITTVYEIEPYVQYIVANRIETPFELYEYFFQSQKQKVKNQNYKLKAKNSKVQK